MSDPVLAAIVEFSPWALAKLLQLPEGVIIDRVEQPCDERGILRIRIIGAGWPVAPGCVIPTSVATATTLDCGHHRMTWPWPMVEASTT
jgi:hypothetical protein